MRTQTNAGLQVFALVLNARCIYIRSQAPQYLLMAGIPKGRHLEIGRQRHIDDNCSAVLSPRGLRVDRQSARLSMLQFCLLRAGCWIDTIMKQWIELGIAEIPNNGGTLKLSQRDEEFSIRLSGIRGDLMNSRMHGSEDALAELGCSRLGSVVDAHVLVGGLGMGFTLAAALNALASSSEVTVAELIPAVVAWNQGPLGECAGHPLKDARTRVYIGDVADLVAGKESVFDAILLDVDNGPEGLTHADNDFLYAANGLEALYRALRPEGTLAVWSAGPDPLFLTRLKKAKFHASIRTVRARPGKGSRHTIFLADKTPKIP